MAQVKREKDVIKRAKQIMEIATGEIQNPDKNNQRIIIQVGPKNKKKTKDND